MIPLKTLFLVAVLSTSAGFLAACGSSSNSASTSVGDDAAPVRSGATNSFAALDNSTPDASRPSSSAYRIGPLDVLDISVFKVPELSSSVQVAPSGSINLALLGEVRASGLTAQELERNLTRDLGAKYLQSPQVTVFVKEYNSQRVIVEGAVRRPGVYPVKGSASLLQVIAQAEGLESKADSLVLVLRQTDGKRYAAKFDLDAIKGGRSDDPQIQAGDTVVVGTSAVKESFENILKLVPALGLFAII